MVEEKYIIFMHKNEELLLHFNRKWSDEGSPSSHFSTENGDTYQRRSFSFGTEVTRRAEFRFLIISSSKEICIKMAVELLSKQLYDIPPIVDFTKMKFLDKFPPIFL